MRASLLTAFSLALAACPGSHDRGGGDAGPDGGRPRWSDCRLALESARDGDACEGTFLCGGGDTTPCACSVFVECIRGVVRRTEMCPPGC